MAGDDIALGIVCVAELNDSAFSFEGLVVILNRIADDKVKATVTPEDSPVSFVLRVKVT